MIERLGEMEETVPFTLKGWDTDNSGEFLSWALVCHLKGRTPTMEVTRSRPYRRNDQVCVEQKNSTHARGLLRYFVCHLILRYRAMGKPLRAGDPPGADFAMARECIIGAIRNTTMARAGFRSMNV